MPGESAMALSIAAPKPESPANAEAPTPRRTAAPGQLPPPPRRQASPTPMKWPAFTNALARRPAASTPSEDEAKPAPGEIRRGHGGRTVPEALMDDARAAKESFEHGEYPAAEKTYEKMLAKAPNNVYVLSNLGVVYFREQQVEPSRGGAEEGHRRRAGGYFSAVHARHRLLPAAQVRRRGQLPDPGAGLNPEYAVAHNYLGITASQKGWQEAALKELETAIELDPSYGDACFNLAVVYAMQTPPNKEMARKYYRRATDLGAEPDPASTAREVASRVLACERGALAPHCAAVAKPNHWLVKSEPSTYSWESFVKDGGTAWTGVRNYQARNHLKAMRKGDRVLFYHSVTGKEVVGVATVTRVAYPDPTAEERGLGLCRFEAGEAARLPCDHGADEKNSRARGPAALPQGPALGRAGDGGGIRPHFEHGVRRRSLKTAPDLPLTIRHDHRPTSWELILAHLKQPEYVHVLLNPLPIYGLALGGLLSPWPWR